MKPQPPKRPPARTIVGPVNDKKCSYCKNNLGKGAKYAFKNYDNPTIYKCKRMYCKLFRWLGIFKVKEQENK